VRTIANDSWRGVAASPNRFWKTLYICRARPVRKGQVRVDQDGLPRRTALRSLQMTQQTPRSDCAGPLRHGEIVASA
jgi:hypothetical protein